MFYSTLAVLFLIKFHTSFFLIPVPIQTVLKNGKQSYAKDTSSPHCAHFFDSKRDLRQHLC